MIQYKAPVPDYDSDDIGVVQEQVDKRLQYFGTYTGVIEQVVDEDKGLIRYSCLPLKADPEEPESLQYALPCSAKEKEKVPEKDAEIEIYFRNQNPNQAVYRILDDTSENTVNAGGGKEKWKKNSKIWESGDGKSGMEVGTDGFKIKFEGTWYEPPLFLP
jgi:hypothetical protein